MTTLATPAASATTTVKTTTAKTTATTTVDSPLGSLTLTAIDGRLTGLHMHDQRHAPAPSHGRRRDDPAFAEVVAQLNAYFAGTLREFATPLALDGTDFQRRVWEQLRQIPFGETISYGELARRIGNPGAARAVGLATGRNPVAIIVPCHRVVGADGRLTGYAGGLNRKRRLLDLEQAR